MYIWNKVLLGVLIVLLLGCFYLASGTLRIHSRWRSEANYNEAAIAQLQQQNVLLLEGGPGRQGIRQARAELYKLLVARGRAWKIGNREATQPTESGEDPRPPPWQVQLDAEAGAAEIEFVVPEGFAPEQNHVLFLFDLPQSDPRLGAEPQPAGAVEPAPQTETSENVAHYLGEFKLPEGGRSDDLAERQVAMESALLMSPLELKRLDESQGRRVLYEVMPIDSHEAFSGLSDDELRSRLPDATVDEYLKDGKPAAAEDQERAEDGNYVRRLRDYGSLFHVLDSRRTTLVDLVASNAKDLELLNESIDGSKEQEAFLRGENGRLEQELAELQEQRNAVTALRDSLAAQLEQVQAGIEQTLEANKKLAAELAELEGVAIRQADSGVRSSDVVE